MKAMLKALEWVIETILLWITYGLIILIVLLMGLWEVMKMVGRQVSRVMFFA